MHTCQGRQGKGLVRSLACAVLCCALVALGSGLDAAAHARSRPGSEDPGPTSTVEAGTADRQQSSSARAAGASRDALQQAALLVRQGRLDEAEKHAELALSNPDTRGAAHSVLGAIRFQQQRLDESARLLQEAIRLEPRLIGAHLTLAEVHIAQGHPEPAVALFRRALELDPMNQTARFGLARSEAEKGNYQASLEIARPVLEAFKLFPEGLFVLATDYLKTKDRQAAVGIVDSLDPLDRHPAGVVNQAGSRCTRKKACRPRPSTFSSTPSRSLRPPTSWRSIWAARIC